jgi:hypothetical protein
MGYSNTPQEPEIEGTIISQPGRATVGVWIMPDNQLPGMLEDFVRLLVHEKDKALWDRAVRSVKAIPKKERMFPEIHLAKVHLHTWLAWQEEPGTPIGLAITKRYFDANLPEAQRFIAWLRRLFVEDVENSPDSGN